MGRLGGGKLFIYIICFGWKHLQFICHCPVIQNTMRAGDPVSLLKTFLFVAFFLYPQLQVIVILQLDHFVQNMCQGNTHIPAGDVVHRRWTPILFFQRHFFSPQRKQRGMAFSVFKEHSFHYHRLFPKSFSSTISHSCRRSPAGARRALRGFGYNFFAIPF